MWAWSSQKVKRARWVVFYLSRYGTLRKTEDKMTAGTHVVHPGCWVPRCFINVKQQNSLSWLETLSKDWNNCFNWVKVFPQSHLRTGEFTHHEVGVFKSVVVVIIVAGWWRTLSPECSPARASAVVLGVKRIHNDGLCTLNLTAAKRTTCPLTFWLL